MEAETHDGRPARVWTVMETQTLLDLIRDMGFIPALTRKGFQNWDVFERICVFLNRCNVQVSSADVKAHWQSLKAKFWRLKRLADASFAQVSVIAADYPFYQEMALILTPHNAAGCYKREADSSGQESQVSPSSSVPDSGLGSDHEDQTASSSRQQAEGEQHAAEPGAVAEAPDVAPPDVQEGAEPNAGQDIQRAVVMLRNTTHQILSVTDRLLQSLSRLSRVQEQLSIQLGFIYSAAFQLDGELRNDSPEEHPPREPARTSETLSSRRLLRRYRLLRYGQRRSARHHP
ncbi:uncharacterized protein LOC135053501 [Pseudophryne corroboree]|uniref:uncharacterized protein LOC135053501 n=1 Tax=Pseudophryne corroboree TaxID=495146 RepID=UPI00308203D8